MFKKFVTAALAALALAACSPKQEKICTGDIIFVGIPSDYSLDEGSMDEAITKATGSGRLNLIHAAIAEVDSAGCVWIIDATLRRGVDRHPLDTMRKDFTLKDGSQPVYIVKRLKDNSKAAQFVEAAKQYLGRPYDNAFLPDNEAMYCTELIRDSYRDVSGEYVFPSRPMNFKDADGNMPVYWEQLFAILGIPVPQGVPGTNPQDMSSEDVLKEVFNF